MLAIYQTQWLGIEFERLGLPLSKRKVATADLYRAIYDQDSETTQALMICHRRGWRRSDKLHAIFSKC